MVATCRICAVLEQTTLCPFKEVPLLCVCVCFVSVSMLAYGICLECLEVGQCRDEESGVGPVGVGTR